MGGLQPTARGSPTRSLEYRREVAVKGAEVLKFLTNDEGEAMPGFLTIDVSAIDP
jgi:hypothetical protein